MWLNNTDCLCFPCAAYELRHSSDLLLLTKWPAILQNTFGNRAYVNQTNLNGKLRKTAKRGAKQKSGGHGPPRPPLESPLSFACRHRRSLGGPRGHVPPNFRTYSHLWFERRYHNQNSVIRLKSNILTPPNFWAGDATACKSKLPNLQADCFTVGLYRVIITWQQIFKCSLQVTILGVLLHVTLERRHLGR